MALTVFSLGAPIGAWIGADIAGIVNDHYNWRTVFLVLGIPGVIVGLLIFFTVREPRRGQLDKKGGDQQGRVLPRKHALPVDPAIRRARDGGQRAHGACGAGA